MILQILLKKNKYETDGSDFEDKINKVDKKIPDVIGLVKKTDFNAKISEVTEIEGKIPDVSSLATNSALTAVENKIPNVASLITKPYFDAEFKKLVAELLQINLNICLLKIS